MNRTDHRGRGFAMFFLWTIVGTTVGTGVAYFVYARQAPVFESTATLKVMRSETGVEASADHSDLRPQQQAAVADERGSDSANLVSGFRMTDDASQDPLLQEATESQEESQVFGSSNGNGSAGDQQSPRKQSPDDSLLLVSQAVLERAVELGGLQRVQELQWMVSVRDQSPEAFVRAWVNNGSLRVQKSGDSSLGGVYRIGFRSRLPSTSQKVVQAVAAAAVEKFDTDSFQTQQAEVLDLLTSGRMEIDKKIQNLDQRLSELPAVPEAMLRDGAVFSPEAVRLDAIVGRFERLQLKRDGLKENLRRAETLLTEGADRRLVLEALGAAPPQSQLASRSRPQDPDVTQPETNESSKAAAEYRDWLDQRNKLIEKVESEVAPMQERLDALIEKKYGPNHPAVSHVRGQIGRVRAQLANLPPEPDGIGIVIPKTNASPAGSPNANEAGSNGSLRAEGMSLVALLRAMRSELSGVLEEIQRLDPELESLSTTVASQDKALHRRESVEQEILQQRSLRNAMIKKIQNSDSEQSRSGISCELLVPGSAGVQVEPDLQSHLMAGGMLGGASGAILFLLILVSVTAVATDGESSE